VDPLGKEGARGITLFHTNPRSSLMSAPFAATLERPEERSSSGCPLLVSDIRLCYDHETTLSGVGEERDSGAAPFARFAARASFPMTGEGAATTASFATDTGTVSAVTPGRGGRLIIDDSHLDDR
jgi:hypothetical protein